MTAPDRLYGVPGAEALYRDIAEAYESQIEPFCDDHEGTRIIEEWTVLPAGSTFRSPADIVDWLCEDAADDAPDGWYDCIEHLDHDPVVLAAAEALRAALIERATPYWIADRRVAEHTITWDAEGEPLVNGEPMYVKAKRAESVLIPAEARPGCDWCGECDWCQQLGRAEPKPCGCGLAAPTSFPREPVRGDWCPIGSLNLHHWHGPDCVFCGGTRALP